MKSVVVGRQHLRFHGQDRAGRMGDNVFRGGANEHLSKPGLAPGIQDHQAGTRFQDIAGDGLTNVQPLDQHGIDGKARSLLLQRFDRFGQCLTPVVCLVRSFRRTR